MCVFVCMEAFVYNIIQISINVEEMKAHDVGITLQLSVYKQVNTKNVSEKNRKFVSLHRHRKKKTFFRSSNNTIVRRSICIWAVCLSVRKL